MKADDKFPVLTKGTYTNLYLRAYGYWSYNNQSFSGNVENLYIANSVTTLSVTPNSGSADVTDYTGTSRKTNSSQFNFTLSNLANVTGGKIRNITVTITNCAGPTKWAIGIFTSSCKVVLS